MNPTRLALVVWMWGSDLETMMGNGEGPLSPDDPGARNLLLGRNLHLPTRLDLP